MGQLVDIKVTLVVEPIAMSEYFDRGNRVDAEATTEIVQLGAIDEEGVG